MDYPGIEAFVVILSGVLLGATFATIDAALSALDEVRLLAVRDLGGPDAKAADRVLRERTVIQARLLAGRVVSVGAAAGMGAVLGLQWWHGWLPGLAAGAVVALVYGMAAEIGATIAVQRASSGALRLLRWLRPLEILMAPVAAPLVALSSAVRKLIPVPKNADDESLTELAVEHMIEQGEERGSIHSDHAELLRSVLEFKNTVAREVMVPRTHVVAIEIDMPLTEVLAMIIEEGHSRYPVYRDRLDHIEGILYAKDLFLAQRTAGDGAKLADLIRRPVYFAAETQKVTTLLREMQSRRVHLAVVVDEFGGTSGIVTLEDILEEIVGEIQDEHDEEPPPIVELGPDHWVVDAGVSVYDVEERIGGPLGEEDGDYDSIGGMVIAIAGRVPQVGESVRSDGWDLIVREADEKRVTRIELRRRAVADQPNAAE